MERLHVGATAVLAVIRTLGDDWDGSASMIKARLDITDHGLKSALRALVSSGTLVVHRRRAELGRIAGPNIYTLVGDDVHGMADS